MYITAYAQSSRKAIWVDNSNSALILLFCCCSQAVAGPNLKVLGGAALAQHRDCSSVIFRDARSRLVTLRQDVACLAATELTSFLIRREHLLFVLCCIVAAAHEFAEFVATVAVFAFARD
jgi:hypothetical protein